METAIKRRKLYNQSQLKEAIREQGYHCYYACNFIHKTVVVIID